ncbi:hypothetical protein K505DRAFT_331284 [Melanomma pulvis-pyrius CBS 109.77]|uniref:Uncharacterized protein n=1 Tax=Melanomma pulvis-pyrius CBS 109.77 TaxID=1314802 RepID=A0A6A6XXV9_9PLEO|nr:hypothetical protein K505DRAFT_331284 [Melanomma pulvis-pyrius CBS 109.77]
MAHGRVEDRTVAWDGQALKPVGGRLRNSHTQVGHVEISDCDELAGGAGRWGGTSGTASIAWRRPFLPAHHSRETAIVLSPFYICPFSTMVRALCYRTRTRATITAKRQWSQNYRKKQFPGDWATGLHLTGIHTGVELEPRGSILCFVSFPDVATSRSPSTSALLRANVDQKSIPVATTLCEFTTVT